MVGAQEKRFEQAIELYSQSLELIGTHQTDAVTILSNRAACHQQLRQYHAVVRDCDAALELSPSAAKVRSFMCVSLC